MVELRSAFPWIQVRILDPSFSYWYFSRGYDPLRVWTCYDILHSSVITWRPSRNRTSDLASSIFCGIYRLSMPCEAPSAKSCVYDSTLNLTTARKTPIVIATRCSSSFRTLLQQILRPPSSSAHLLRGSAPSRKRKGGVEVIQKSKCETYGLSSMVRASERISEDPGSNPAICIFSH